MVINPPRRLLPPQRAAARRIPRSSLSQSRSESGQRPSRCSAFRSPRTLLGLADRMIEGQCRASMADGGCAYMRCVARCRAVTMPARLDNSDMTPEQTLTELARLVENGAGRLRCPT
jgi:hypothetical protein